MVAAKLVLLPLFLCALGVQAVPAKSGAVAAAAAAEAFNHGCSQGAGWVRYRDSCYRFNETSEYWYPAELGCRRHGGHLVSIGDRLENNFVAKLTYCLSAWTGRYALSVDQLTNPNNYRWTDGSSNGGFHAHDFGSISSVHQPLVTAQNSSWHNRVYHAKDRHVCKVKSPGGAGNGTCERGWRHLGSSCYLMPDFPVTWIEANFHCAGKDAHLASVYTDFELRALSLLDLESDGCPADLWLGLIKINPCRIDLFSSKPICYKWADRKSDLYNGFPAWHPGYPDTGEKVNCVLLRDRAMMTAECHERRRFVCKKPAA